MTREEYEEFADSVPGLPIPATPANIELARAFLLRKWKERAAELGKPEPKDLSDSCKFSSQFARVIFGGELRGNVDHQFIQLPNGRYLDLNLHADDVQNRIEHPHIHDDEFFGNPEHEESMASCRGRVLFWVEEFIKLLKSRKPTTRVAGVKENFDQRVENSSKPGMFVGIKFSPETVNNLLAWCKDNKIPNRTEPSEYHTTVIFSKTRKFPYNPIRWDPPLIVDPATYALDLFGPRKDTLVLRYDCAELDARHWNARIDNKLTWDYDEFVPHVTLSNLEVPFSSLGIGLHQIALPQFPLEIVSEYIKDFEPK